MTVKIISHYKVNFVIKSRFYSKEFACDSIYILTHTQTEPMIHGMYT